MLKSLKHRFWILSLTCFCLVGVLGCAQKGGPEVTQDASANSAGDSIEEAEETVPELTEEELVLVKEQIYCPVGGELGSMGTPVKVMVDGNPVFICCEGCRGPLLKNPEKYLAELAEKKAKAAEKVDETKPETPAEKEAS